MKLNIEYVDIDKLIPYENNPRDNEDAVDKVMKSIKEFGFKVPIIANANGVIITGHTRYKAAKELHLKQVPVIYATDLTEKQIKAFRIADNKVSDFSLWDNKKLLEELEDLDDIFTGFNISDVFGEELNEKDTTFLDDIVQEYGEQNYIVNYKCANKEQYDDIIQYIESTKDIYEK